jgi:hypothetical protein
MKYMIGSGFSMDIPVYEWVWFSKILNIWMGVFWNISGTYVPKSIERGPPRILHVTSRSCLQVNLVVDKRRLFKDDQCIETLPKKYLYIMLLDRFCQMRRNRPRNALNFPCEMNTVYFCFCIFLFLYIFVFVYFCFCLFLLLFIFVFVYFCFCLFLFLYNFVFVYFCIFLFLYIFVFVYFCFCIFLFLFIFVSVYFCFCIFLFLFIFVFVYFCFSLFLF